MMHVLVVRLSIVVMVGLGSSQSVMAQGRTENVVLVTLDGARYQEVFGGLDRDLLQSTAGKAPLESLTSYKKFWASTPEERRQRLLPFFWGTLMTHGSVAGNQSLGSVARITNSHRFSYPGYSEILTGEAHDAEIKSNDLIQNPFETVLEFVRRKLNLPKSKVAAFASWGVFSGIVEHVPGAITSNAGMQRSQSPDPLLRQINDLQFEVLAPWDMIRHDTFTFRLAMDYLKTQKPRLLYLALDETDDWAHDGKYRPRSGVVSANRQSDSRTLGMAGIGPAVSRKDDTHHHDRPRSGKDDCRLAFARQGHRGRAGHLGSVCRSRQPVAWRVAQRRAGVSESDRGNDRPAIQAGLRRAEADGGDTHRACSGCPRPLRAFSTVGTR